MKQRKFQEDSAKCDRMMDDMIMKQLDNIGFDEPEDEHVNAPIRASQAPATRLRTATNSRPTRTVSTLRSREAAAALSAAPKPRVTPARVSPTPKPGLVSSLMPKKHARAPSNPSSMRNTAAAATSNTTVGYSKGRSVSSTLRENTISERTATTSLSPETYMRLYGIPPLGSEMWTRCKAAGCFDAEEDAGQELEECLPTFGEDAEADDFQLTL